MDDSDGTVAVHESGHAVVAAVLGVRPGPVGIVPGTGRGSAFHVVAPWDLPAAGVDPALPFVLWDPLLKSQMERNAVVLLAGDIAERLLTPRTVRAEASATELVEAGIVGVVGAVDELPAPTEDEARDMSGHLARPAAKSDAQQVAELAWMAHGSDVGAAATWTAFLEAQARVLVLAHSGRILSLAERLAVDGTLGAEAVAALLAG